MRYRLINVGNKAYVNIDRVKCIVDSDADRVRRELVKGGFKDRNDANRANEDQSTKNAVYEKRITKKRCNISSICVEQRLLCNPYSTKYIMFYSFCQDFGRPHFAPYYANFKRFLIK